MAKLITILAASIGGGVVLGAGIRLFEKAVDVVDREPDGARLFERLDLVEQRLAQVENGNHRPGAAAMEDAVSVLHSRLDSQQADLTSIRAQLADGNPGIDRFAQIGEQLRAELQGWTEEGIRRQIAAAEAKLQSSIESTRKNTLDAFVEGVQTRVAGRISKLEEEVAGQSAAMTELRECSLRTEHSMQKLLEGIDRLVGTQARASIKPRELSALDSEPRSEGATPEHDAAIVSPNGVPAIAVPDAEHEEKPKFRRWGLFR